MIQGSNMSGELQLVVQSHSKDSCIYLHILIFFMFQGSKIVGFRVDHIYRVGFPFCDCFILNRQMHHMHLQSCSLIVSLPPCPGSCICLIFSLLSHSTKTPNSVIICHLSHFFFCIGQKLRIRHPRGMYMKTDPVWQSASVFVSMKI